jgi:hypothetical protein
LGFADDAEPPDFLAAASLALVDETEPASDFLADEFDFFEPTLAPSAFLRLPGASSSSLTSTTDVETDEDDDRGSFFTVSFGFFGLFGNPILTSSRPGDSLPGRFATGRGSTPLPLELELDREEELLTSDGSGTSISSSRRRGL